MVMLDVARGRRQIRLVEEPCEQHKVAKVHGDRQFDVQRRYVTRRSATAAR